ncbi:MAG: hypothetical protein H0T74_13580 [Rubrobacteraceae bacterium]|nr:hypothetical protein [Rubrobacteraceae bacterium]
MAVSPKGVIIGFGFGTASTADQPMAETFLAARRRPSPRLSSVGRAAAGCHVADKGFEGEENRLGWLDRYGARVISSQKE